jgi:opacity protein-like surface antigen
MRRLFLAAILIASIPRAFAADYELPTLRGSDDFGQVTKAAYPRWDGFYIGGQLGFGVASVDFARTTQPVVAYLLRETALENEQHPSDWGVLGKADVTGASFGGFLGYSTRWESLILGFELNYSWANMTTAAPTATISRSTSTSNGLDYFVTVTGDASIRITEYGTLRARAGFDAGIVLPYAMIGLAVGRADLARSATVSGIECDSTPICSPFSFSNSETKNGAFLYGWALGGGFDLMLMPGVFVRGEYEYVAFSPVWDIKSNIQTGRMGLGLKF